jgi:hypothetical protein
MAKEQYNVSLKDKQENVLVLFTTLLIIASTVYSLYLSQHADFFVMNLLGIAEFTNTDSGKKVYGIILLLSAFKLLILLGLLNTKHIAKKLIYSFTLVMVVAIAGNFSFGLNCPEMVNNNVYYCQQTLLVDNKINMVMMCLLAVISYINYRKVQLMEKHKLKVDTV